MKVDRKSTRIYSLGFISQESSTDHPRTQDLSPIPPTPDQLPTDSSIASKTRYSVLKPAMISMSNASHLVEPQGTSSSPCVEASPEGVLPDPIHLPTVTHLRTPEESPSSIVLESPPAELQTGLGVFLTVDFILVK